MNPLFGRLITAATFSTAAWLAGCATQTPPVDVKESQQTQDAQRKAQASLTQAAPATVTLKRKIALGRVSNETQFGRSLLVDKAGDPLGKQVSDLLSKTLTSTGQYLVFERPDLGIIKNEQKLSGGSTSNLIGVDALVIGSLTEFGRKTVGETGFVSSTKKQVAFAKVDLRLVDVSTGLVFFATSGAGEASTESSSVFGFGSQATYDGTLNDAAVRQAVSEAVSRMSAELAAKPWQTSFLAAEQGQLFMSGGRAQGIQPGQVFSVLTQGQKVKSPQTGFEVTLPGKPVAEIKVESTFGDNDSNEGSVVSVVSGSIQGLPLNQLVIREKKQ